MSERQSSPAPTSEQLFSRLTSLAYKHDYQFERGHTDAMDIKRKVRVFAGQVPTVDDYDTTLPIYNEQTLRFTAEREFSLERHRQPTDPIGFAIQQEIIKQVPRIPDSIVSRIEPAVAECYDMSEPGDLNVVTFVHYAILREDGDIAINRNIGYKLRDIKEVVYESSELIGQPAPQLIPLAHRQETLRCFEPIKEEAAEDQLEQLFFNEQFDAFRDGVANMAFFMEFSDARDADAITSILGLVKCLNQRRPLPKHLLL
jgi:hypothetical protein